jgi:hypothetical protein
MQRLNIIHVLKRLKVETMYCHSAVPFGGVGLHLMQKAWPSDSEEILMAAKLHERFFCLAEPT